MLIRESRNLIEEEDNTLEQSKNKYLQNMNLDQYTTNTKIGYAKRDLTVDPYNSQMLGYGNLNHVTQGIGARTYVHTMFMEFDSINVLAIKQISYLIISVCDLCFITDKVKKNVIGLLNQMKFRITGHPICESNLVLCANHTHCASGGHTGYQMFDLNSLGFSQKNHDLIVHQIAHSIIKAYEVREPDQLHFTHDNFPVLGVNRSPEAYVMNQDIDLYETNTDTLVQVLKCNQGMICWHPLHATSLTVENPYINSDNKGYSSVIFEKIAKDRFFEKKFCIFAQANSGDVSPNQVPPTDYDLSISAMYSLAEIQAQNAMRIFQMPTEKDNFKTAPIDKINLFHRYIKMSEYITPSAYGISFPAGSDNDHSPFPFVKEGVTTESSTVLKLFSSLTSYGRAHAPKPILVPSGYLGEAFVPNNLPFQVILLGAGMNFVSCVLSIPFEVTTMAGRRIRNNISTFLGELFKTTIAPEQIILSCLTNSYASYLTTPEEYSLQYYEGASTIFGPKQLEKVINIFRDLILNKVCETSYLEYSLIVDPVTIKEKSFKIYAYKINTSNTFIEIELEINNPHHYPLIDAYYLTISQEQEKKEDDTQIGDRGTNLIEILNDDSPEILIKFSSSSSLKSDSIKKNMNKTNQESNDENELNEDSLCQTESNYSHNTNNTNIYALITVSHQLTPGSYVINMVSGQIKIPYLVV
jgi:neutral ceramidase